MTKVKANFENQKVNVGLDVHKHSWNAAIFLGDYFVRNIRCMAVNPADIPSTHKDNVYKTDARNARGIGQALCSGNERPKFSSLPD